MKAISSVDQELTKLLTYWCRATQTLNQPKRGALIPVAIVYSHIWTRPRTQIKTWATLLSLNSASICSLSQQIIQLKQDQQTPESGSPENIWSVSFIISCNFMCKGCVLLSFLFLFFTTCLNCQLFTVVIRSSTTLMWCCCYLPLPVAGLYVCRFGCAPPWLHVHPLVPVYWPLSLFPDLHCLLPSALEFGLDLTFRMILTSSQYRILYIFFKR